MSRKKTYSVAFGTTTDAKAGNGDGNLTRRSASVPQPAVERALKAEPRHALIHTATPSTVRAINRSIILNLIRLHQPISRAELSHRTGIFRSNISDIVEELIAQELVVEKRGRPIGPGRVPMLLSLNSDGARVLAVSVRPSETLVAAAGLTGNPARTSRVYQDVAGDNCEIPREIPRSWSCIAGDRYRSSWPGECK